MDCFVTSFLAKTLCYQYFNKDCFVADASRNDIVYIGFENICAPTITEQSGIRQEAIVCAKTSLENQSVNR
jgi:hypothetical protein